MQLLGSLGPNSQFTIRNLAGVVWSISICSTIEGIWLKTVTSSICFLRTTLLLVHFHVQQGPLNKFRMCRVQQPGMSNRNVWTKEHSSYFIGSPLAPSKVLYWFKILVLTFGAIHEQAPIIHLQPINLTLLWSLLWSKPVDAWAFWQNERWPVVSVQRAPLMECATASVWICLWKNKTKQIKKQWMNLTFS